jgi:hypothetical protein
MARPSLLVLVLVFLQPLVLVPITGASSQQQGLAKHRFVILKLQFDPLSLDIYSSTCGAGCGAGCCLGINCMASMSPKLLCCGIIMGCLIMMGACACGSSPRMRASIAE